MSARFRVVLVSVAFFVMAAFPSWADRPGGGCIVFESVIGTVPILVSDHGIENSITQKLTNAEGAFMAGQTGASVGILMALDNEIVAQTDKGIGLQSAEVLRGDIQDLIAYVTNPKE
jgi:hypothetical protein